MRPCTLHTAEFLRLLPMFFWNHFMGVILFLTHVFSRFGVGTGLNTFDFRKKALISLPTITSRIIS